MLVSDVLDLSHLDSPYEVTNDDESTPELYVAAFISDDTLSLMFFGDEQFDDFSNEEIEKQMRAFAAKPQTRELMKVDSIDDLRYHIYRYYQTDEDIARLEHDLMCIVNCKPLPLDEPYYGQDAFVAYHTWNGDTYDDILKIMILLSARKIKGKLSPYITRQLSNLIIHYKGRPYEFFKYVEHQTRTNPVFGDLNKTPLIEAELKLMRNMARYADGHVDWAKIAKAESNDEGEGTVMPPGLKKELARWGYDVIFDESVTVDERRIWSQEDKDTLVDYVFNDTLGTRDLSKRVTLRTALTTRDTIRKQYPYTSAQSINFADLTKKEPPARDDTSARIIGSVLIGPKKIRPVDSETIHYNFPIPVNGDLEKTMHVDLLEYIRDKEDLHPFFFEFFEHWRGKDIRDRFLEYKIKQAQPITHGPTMNLPYFHKGKPIDAFATLSTGGAHGSCCAYLHTLSGKKLEAWIRANKKIDGENKVTIDVRNIIHIDFSSYYPTLASKLKLYITADGVDRYSPIMTKRLHTKKLASEFEERGEFDNPEYLQLLESSDGDKFVLNNATGAGNTHRERADLPLDNKTISMRLIGNMIIYVLGQRLAEAGAYIISTNTDGLYICNMELDVAQAILDDFIADYGMPVEPEPMARFINRDASNRIEMKLDAKQVSKVGGDLKHAKGLRFSDSSFGSNVTYPLIAGNAAIHYMVENEDWLQTPYDPQVIRSYIEEQATKIQSVEDLQAWYHVNIGTKARRFTVNGKPQQKINRVVLTKEGSKLGAEELRTLATQPMKEVSNQLLEGTAHTMRDITIPSLPEFEWESAIRDRKLSELEFAFIVNNKINKREDNWESVSDELYTFETRIFKHEKEKLNGASKETLDKLKTEINNKVDLDKKLLVALKNPTLGYRIKGEEKWKPLKIWKPSSRPTGYTSIVGKTLNLRQDLIDFDPSELDLNAYIEWAEDLLSSWKSSADVPIVNMKSIDDTVREKVKSSRVSKKSQALSLLTSIFTESTQGGIFV